MMMVVAFVIVAVSSIDSLTDYIIKRENDGHDVAFSVTYIAE